MCIGFWCVCMHAYECQAVGVLFKTKHLQIPYFPVLLKCSTGSKVMLSRSCWGLKENVSLFPWLSAFRPSQMFHQLWQFCVQALSQFLKCEANNLFSELWSILEDRAMSRFKTWKCFVINFPYMWRCKSWWYYLWKWSLGIFFFA